MTRDGQPDKGHDWLDTWKTMEDLYLAHPEKLKAIGQWPKLTCYLCTNNVSGVSNFSVEYFERLLKVARVVPAVNQIELHP
jgi:glycerol 2-dehydrogenase (NADP+)